MGKDNDDTARTSETLFEPGARPHGEEKPPGKCGVWWKGLVVLLLAVAVTAALIARSRSDRAAGEEATSSSGTVAAEDDGPSVPPDTVLATVNGEEITARELEETLRSLPEQYRAEFRRRKDALLDELITRKLLLQEAYTSGVPESEEYRRGMAEHEAHPGHEEHVLIDALLRRDVFGKGEVTDDDLRAFYEEYRDQLPGSPGFDDAKELIRPSVRQQKEYEALEEYLAGLRERASITRNEEWIEAQKKLAADNPLDRALQGGRPVLADFGRGTCIPCKMMKPILDRLARELQNNVHVLILDTGEYGYLARRYRIRVIPTQIFFDENGKELFRHEGFMSREDILAKLKELGMLQDRRSGERTRE